MDCRWNSILQRGTNGCKGPKLSDRGRGTGNNRGPVGRKIEENGGKRQRWDEQRDQKDTSLLDQVEFYGSD